ncbi:MAG: Hpt domain-containing protein [Prochlorothrix sp.]|nr:Hpt domain-containing protein [Prochlorothrix sp.]
MDAQRQQVLGFFIEEAREHLTTIEKGLLNLQEVLADSEQVNELFRAAHSVKGGAAMLGFSSVQKVAHRLEDCFKILKEETDNPQVDQVAEDLFLRGFDTLQQLLEELQSPEGLADDEGEQAVAEIKPVFRQLQDHLNQLTGAGGGAAPIPPDFAPQVMGVLKEMLALFKQAESDAARQKLQGCCDRLTGLAAEVAPWTNLTQTAKRAVANPRAKFQVLAPVLIKELKTGSETVAAGKAESIQLSANLQKLAGAAPAGATPAPAAAPAAPAAATSNEIVIPRDPKGAAQVLVKSFDRKQLTELAQILIKVIKGQ